MHPLKVGTLFSIPDEVMGPNSPWQCLLGSTDGRSGNQHDLARQKNLKKTQEIHIGKRKEDSLSASQRKQRDSEIMQQKQKAANERKSLQAGAK
ncbi:LOW QUALITY PROTEIN: small EDRK-rich factor 1-like [Vidua macroura]|uniref:LOW QUALITY PROTEIN: small EDRK-rich factor 1-like n=1 Tax=Vidua macroura TaxID=187451 RepID=UPI0023A7DCEF|nr:LOW QUALITY PROTEIN: small EDRK-rich factor 1-like [Vidua macroura]